MKSIACLRVSTAQQDAGSQRLAILEYARENGFQIDDFVEATAWEQATPKHRRINVLIGILERGDRLVVSQLSRLGRSLGQIVSVLDGFAKAGVAFIAIKENICVEGKQDIQTKVMTTLFALFAEVERDLISERTREGLAKSQGLRQDARAPERIAGRVASGREGGRNPSIHRSRRLPHRNCKDNGRLPVNPLQLHGHAGTEARQLACISTRIWPTPFQRRRRKSVARLPAGKSGRISERTSPTRIRPTGPAVKGVRMTRKDGRYERRQEGRSPVSREGEKSQQKYGRSQK